jgi:hypothetical protein
MRKLSVIFLTVCSIALFVARPATSQNYLNIQTADLPGKDQSIVIPLFPKTLIRFSSSAARHPSEILISGHDLIYRYPNDGTIVFSNYDRLIAHHIGTAVILENETLGDLVEVVNIEQEFLSIMAMAQNPKIAAAILRERLKERASKSLQSVQYSSGVVAGMSVAEFLLNSLGLVSTNTKTKVSTFDRDKIPNIEALGRSYTYSDVLTERLTDANRYAFYSFLLFKDNSSQTRGTRFTAARAYACLFDHASDLKLLSLSAPQLGILYYPLRLADRPEEFTDEQAVETYNYALGLQLWRTLSRLKGSELPSVSIVGFEGSPTAPNIQDVLSSKKGQSILVANLDNFSFSQMSKVFLSLRERLTIPATADNLHALGPRSISAFRQLLGTIGGVVTNAVRTVPAAAQSPNNAGRCG